jgi:hypothetical protein
MHSWVHLFDVDILENEHEVDDDDDERTMHDFLYIHN